MRANRSPTAYSPDNPPPDDGDVDADGSTREDLLILSAIIRGVDIMEIDSPPRVTEVCRKYWLEPGESLDLKSGWDLSDRCEQQQARALVRARAPYLIICFPPCTKFSNLQNLGKAINGPEWHEQIEIELEQAKAHVQFCVGTCPSCSPLLTPQACFGSEQTNACTAWSRRTRKESTRRRRSQMGFSAHRGVSSTSSRSAAMERMCTST